MLTLNDVRQARERLGDLLPRTPLVPSATLSQLLGCRVSLKLERFQKTGSFKPRGAFNKMLSLPREHLARGVVAVSGGNHAQGVAYAASRLGARATICMPESTPANYVEATRGYGAEVVLVPDIRTAFAEVERRAAQGQVLVHPFDDPLVAAGQGTVGLEIVEDAPDVTCLYISIGGGGLLTGIATAVRGLRPQTTVVGVETEGADAMARALATGAPVELPGITSIARTLAPKVCEFTLEATRRLAREVVVVSDSEAFAALVLLLERVKVLTEPAASCCLAAALRQRQQLRPSDHVVLLLCGGNVALADLCAWRQRFTA